jgi:iron complex transport system substrate-binding protein
MTRRPPLRVNRHRDHRSLGKLPTAALVAVGLSVLIGQLSGAGQAEPRRIISLVPAVTEMLFAIGAGPQVVGVSSFDRYPPEAATRPPVGALLDPDFERILSLKPDLVVAYGSQTDLVDRLRQTAIAVHEYRLGGLGNVTATIRGLGVRVGRRQAASELADRIDRDLAAIRSRASGRRRPTTAVVFGREPGTLRGLFVSGGVGFLHDLLELAGGRNVFADVPRENLQVSSEQLLARAPEIIVEVRGSVSWSAARFLQERDVWRALPSLPAVRNGRIHILADDKLTIPGPRIVESAIAFADALDGSAR